MTMRAARLRHYVEVWAMSGDPPRPTLAGNVWMAIDDQIVARDMSRRGIRQAVPTTCISRACDLVRPDRYMTWRGRLFLIDGIDERESANEFYTVMCTEFVAPTGTYTPAGGNAFDLRAFVQRQSDLIGQFALKSERVAVIEVSQFELAVPWQIGDSLLVEGVVWDLHSTVDGGDDGVVVRLQGNAREA